MSKEPKRISRCSIWFKGKKVGTAESGDRTLNDNGEDHVTDDGWTMSDGTTTAEIKLNRIVPVDGTDSALKDALINKEFVTLQLSLIDGKTETYVARNVTDSVNWDNKTGAMKGSVTFRAGAPSLS